jgi:hypothetical protein
LFAENFDRMTLESLALILRIVDLSLNFLFPNKGSNAQTCDVNAVSAKNAPQ